MGLMDAQEYDPRPAQRRWRIIGIAVIAVLVVGSVWWFFRFYPEEQVINRFFQALERKDYDAAYAIYNADPDWKQHPGKYDQYTQSQFLLDWGPSGDYGTISSHHVDCSIEPPRKAFYSPSGVIIVVTINNVAAKPLSMWVEKKSQDDHAVTAGSGLRRTEIGQKPKENGTPVTEQNWPKGRFSYGRS